MGLSQFPAPTSGLSVARFQADYNKPFLVPAGLTLQHTVTSTTTYSAGQLPAQVWVVMAGGGGAGGKDQGAGGGGGGTCIGWVDVPSAGITATIGAGGTGQTTYVGNPGGNTYFGSYVAFGGGGGGCVNDTFYSQSNGPIASVYPRGAGAGYGGFNPNISSASSFYTINNQCAPFKDTTILSGSTAAFMELSRVKNLIFNNYYGGGAGGNSDNYNQSYSNLGAPGGSGLTGGGGAGSGAGTGGSSSRDGGLTNTYSGGTGSAGNGTGGGGAGLLAAGASTTTSVAGAGGSGGGGGGGANSWSYTPGNGGNGCILIYY